jgi:4-hydroxy-2-oxoheptanedioate aldolase
VFGFFVMEFVSPTVWPILEPTGVDYAIIDMESSAFSYRDVGTLLAGARSTNVPALVRVAELTKAAIGRVLDMGADGIIATRVASKEEAEAIVRYAKFAPDGERNAAFRTAHDGYGSGNWAEVIREANEGVACIAMVETKDGVAAIADICATPGLDAVFIGPADLTHSLGVVGQLDSDVYQEAEERILQACLDSGVAAGTYAQSGEDIVQKLKRGFRVIYFASDISLMQDTLSQQTAELRSVAHGLEQKKSQV